jgi:hypothetical protein
MITEDQAVVMLQHMLNRPEMYATCPEALEVGVLLVLYFINPGKRIHDEFHQFVKKKYSEAKGKNLPIWQLRTFTVKEYADLLHEFVVTWQIASAK